MTLDVARTENGVKQTNTTACDHKNSAGHKVFIEIILVGRRFQLLKKRKEKKTTKMVALSLATIFIDLVARKSSKGDRCGVFGLFTCLVLGSLDPGNI